MLDKIKQYISDLPDVDFNDYYQQYILDVQDNILLQEFTSLKFGQYLTIEQLIAKIHAELDKI